MQAYERVAHHLPVPPFSTQGHRPWLCGSIFASRPACAWSGNAAGMWHCLSFEAARRWGREFGPDYAHRLTRKCPSLNDIWHLDDDGRLIHPNDVVRAIAIPASEESGLMTGAILNFDQAVWRSEHATFSARTLDLRIGRLTILRAALI